MRFTRAATLALLSCAAAMSGTAPNTPAYQAVGARTSPNAAPEDSFRSDRDMVQALQRRDLRALGQLLDPEFTWTDAQGRTFTSSQVLKNLPAPVLGDESQVQKFEQINDHVVIHRSERNKVYVLRVWVKRPGGWRILVYQEVSQTAPPPQAESAPPSCENPCKTVPFHAKTADEREVIEAYQQVETAVAAHDAAAWGSHIADEFFAVTSNSDHPVDKHTRMAGLQQQQQGGIAPFPLVSARMFQFADTIVMTSQQQPDHDKALHVTRIWVKRTGRWQELFSYQTTIGSDPAGSRKPM
jgi:hypothetical protein